MRRIVWASAACVLLVCGYVSAWLAVSRVVNEGVVSADFAQRVRPGFAPLSSFRASDSMCADLLRDCWWNIAVAGDQMESHVFGNPLSPSTPEDTIRRAMRIREAAGNSYPRRSNSD